MLQSATRFPISWHDAHTRGDAVRRSAPQAECHHPDDDPGDHADQRTETAGAAGDGGFDRRHR